MSHKPDVSDMRDLGHEKRPLLRAIRAKCPDCCVGSPGEVRQCKCTDCPLFPYRFGTNPFWNEGAE